MVHPTDRIMAAYCVLHETVRARGWIAWFAREVRARAPDLDVSTETVRRWLRPDVPNHTPMPAEAEVVAAAVIAEARQHLVSRMKELGQ